MFDERVVLYVWLARCICAVILLPEKERKTGLSKIGFPVLWFHGLAMMKPPTLAAGEGLSRGKEGGEEGRHQRLLRKHVQGHQLRHRRYRLTPKPETRNPKAYHLTHQPEARH